MAFYLNHFGANRVPSIGLGTYAFEPYDAKKSDEKQQDRQTSTSVEEIVRHAIGVAGYRHIDTAHAYNNEREIGKGIRRAMKDFGIPRYYLS